MQRPLVGILLLVHSFASAQDPAPGIARELAQARSAVVGDVACTLRCTLGAGAKEVRGRVWLTFTLRAERDRTAPLVLDFGGSDLADVQINEKPATPRAVADHVLLPAEALVDGQNQFAATFRSAVAPTGTPLTSYRDPSDGREFYYTLVVPADAHRLYPCFDQPDLRVRCRLELDLPVDWLAIANGAEAVPGGAVADGRRLWTFRETAPLPTYLLAFACGPFAQIDGPPLQAPGADPQAPLRLFVRPSQRQLVDRDALVRLHSEGVRWLADYFGVDYPFGKLDVVLLPGFPYGGMEHAGAIFYREQALVFDHPPTDGELVRRSTLVYHELSHQWFGNLVTMRWFDDLWLKEGFATFVGHLALAALEPGRQAWLRFLQRVKPRAYEVDGTPGTTPVFQQLQNLADAKSAYGAIVYNKAPAVLRELHDRLGQDAFRAGLKRFLQQHAFGSATWRDLAAALEASSRQDLGRWSERWLLAPSMPQVRVEWQLDGNGIVRAATLRQQGVAGDGSWPLDLELCVFDLAGGSRVVRVRSDAAATPIDALVGTAAPACVLANPADVAYGQFVPDAVSRAWLLEHAGDERDALRRAVMVQALLESVREAELDPAAFAMVALAMLARERDPDTHGFLLDALGSCLGRWLPETRSAPLRARAAELLHAQLRDDGGSGRELQTFRFAARQLRDPATIALCRAMARFGELPRGLTPGKTDRFLAAAALLAAGVEDGEVAALQQHFANDDVGKEVFLARAAAPTAATKAEYWRQYGELEQPPEQWSQDSLPFFHWPGQAALTLQYLRPALELAPWVKQNRRIFFMPAWLDGFVNGHDDVAALAVVDDFLATAKIDDDVRRKLLQSRDGLARSVRIRARFGGDGK